MEKLARFLPLHVVVRLQDNEVQGRIEHSFSMDWSKARVRVFWSGKAYSFLGEHILEGEKDAIHNMNRWNESEFCFNALADDLPIEIDWDQWLADIAAKPGSKHLQRNAKFIVKPHGVWQLRALKAERERNELKEKFEHATEVLQKANEKLEKIEGLLDKEND